MSKSVPCKMCGEPCSGKLNIELRKGTLSSFCTPHFNQLELLSLKDIRIILKNNKHGVIV